MPEAEELPAPDFAAAPFAPDVPLVPAVLSPQLFAAYFASDGLRLAHFEDLLFCPEALAAAVSVAFWCDAPLLLMWLDALSRPVDFALLDGLAEELSVDEPLVEPDADEPLVPREPEVEPLLPMEEPLPLADAPLPEVEEAPLP